MLPSVLNEQLRHYFLRMPFGSSFTEHAALTQVRSGSKMAVQAISGALPLYPNERTLPLHLLMSESREFADVEHGARDYQCGNFFRPPGPLAVRQASPAAGCRNGRARE